jgi:protein-S-isoprenylcysteine O-methyltransferase Ste14
VFAGFLPWRYFGLSDVVIDSSSPRHLLGLAAIGIGVVLLGACISEFARRGRGTLAPVDPPTELVVHGPYRYVRNPMYLSVTVIVLGEALLTGSRALLLYWAVWFAAANLFVIGYEEPTLHRRFGPAYERYRAKVRRWLPRPPSRADLVQPRWVTDQEESMVSRRADVFFYGLFMDPDLLRSKGLVPESVELASVPGFALRIGQRAALVPDRTGRAHGIVMSLTLAELERLYSEPSVQAYQPQAVLAHLASGGIVAALCYNLPAPPAPNDRNPEYASKLRAVAQKVGLPAEYVASLR